MGFLSTGPWILVTEVFVVFVIRPMMRRRTSTSD